LAYLRRVASAPEGARALGRAPGTWASFLHFRAFALSIFDRLVLWFGRERDLRFEVIGREHYDRLLTPTRGAIVVGAHLGSFDALRALADRDRRAVNVLMYTEHAPRINAVFRALSPDVQLRVIQVEPDSMGTVLKIRSCIDRGEIVAMLGDRVEPADRGRTQSVALLGGRIELPEAPYLLAGLLDCPLFFMVALRAPGPRYRVYAEVLSERVDFGRGERDKRIRELAAAYAGRLEHYLLQAPYQWFNFYDLWAEDAR
jgi:predicted LPLAT superfamily acyltransferase